MTAELWKSVEEGPRVGEQRYNLSRLLQESPGANVKLGCDHGL